MTATFELYQRMIERKNGTKEELKTKVGKAHDKGRLTNEEYDQLLVLIEDTFGPDPN